MHPTASTLATSARTTVMTKKTTAHETKCSLIFCVSPKGALPKPHERLFGPPSPNRRLVQCGSPNFVKQRKGHIVYATLSALHHFHVDPEGLGKLSRQQRVAFLQAIDEYLECRDNSGAIGCDDFAFASVRRAQG